MKIAITGGSGLVARAWLSSVKDRKFKICSFQRSLPPRPLHFVHYESLDITDAHEVFNRLQGFDLVIHAAAMVSYHKTDAPTMYEINVNGTANVVNACIQNKIPKLLFISSTAALDSDKKPLEIEENRLWDLSEKKTDYAKSKYYAELEIWRGEEEGLEVASVCPGVVIGDGKDDKSSNQLYEIVRKKWNLYPEGSNGFINALELAKIINLIIDKKAYGHRFLAVTHNISFRELLYQIAKKINMPPPKYSIKGMRFAVLFGFAILAERLLLKSPLPSDGLINTKQNLRYKPKNIYEKLNYTNGSLL